MNSYHPILCVPFTMVSTTAHLCSLVHMLPYYTNIIVVPFCHFGEIDSKLVEAKRVVQGAGDEHRQRGLDKELFSSN